MTSQTINPIDAIEISVASIEPTVSVDEIAETYTRLQGLKRRAKELEEALDARLIAWIKENGDIRWTCDSEGHEMRLYLGHRKSTKCRDMTKACPKILEVCDGDWDRFVNCLSSNALKHGTARKLLTEFAQDDLYDELFETTTKDKLESGAPAPKELQAFDTRYAK